MSRLKFNKKEAEEFVYFLLRRFEWINGRIFFQHRLGHLKDISYRRCSEILEILTKEKKLKKKGRKYFPIIYE